MKNGTRLIFVAVLTAHLLNGGCWRHWFAHERAVDHYVVAMSLHSAAQEDAAIRELCEAVELDQDFSLAHSMLGDLYRQQGRYEQAAGAYESACKLDPWAFNDHFNLGLVYRMMKRFTEAIRVLNRACRLRPKHAQTNYALGVCYYETEDFDQAEVYCARAAKLAPNDEEILVSLGDIYGKKGDGYKAINAYKQALEVNANQVDVMIRLGTAYVKMKRFAPAKLILEKAVDAAPDNPKTYLSLGYCLLWDKDFPQALARYQTALELDRTPEAYNGIGVTYMMMYRANRQDKQLAQRALNHWHQSLELRPNQARIKRLVNKYTRQLYPAGQRQIVSP